jgi:autotransporter-associated beta strand protein
MRGSKTQIKLIYVLILVTGVIAPSARGATVRTWDGGGTDNTWTNATNWVGNIAPVGGDDLVFPANASVDGTSLTSTNNFPVNTAFRSITFQSGSTNYVLNGNAIVLSDVGVVAVSGQSGGTNTLNLAILLGANQTFEQTATGKLLIGGAINLNGRTLTNNAINSSGNTEISGTVSGVGDLVKIGPGGLRLSGTNTYFGLTTINVGLLSVGNASALGSPSVGTVLQGGTLFLENSINVAGESLTNNTTATLFSSDTVGYWSGNIVLNAQLEISNTGFLFFPGPISGSGGITKDDFGQLILGGTNTYAGLTVINNGLFEVTNSFALGATNVGTVLNGTAILLLQNVAIQDEPLTNNSANTEFRSGGAAGWSGDIVANAQLDILAFPGTNDISGGISGSGAIRKSQSGTLSYSGTHPNTYTNSTTVNLGTLLLRKSVGNSSILGPLIIGDGTNAAVVQIQTTSQIGTVPVTVNSNATFDINGIGETFGSLAGSGNMTLGGTTGINFGGDNSSTTFSGVISETGPITKSGSGTMILSGNNTFVGFTTVSGGTLLVNGSQPQSPVIVNSTGTLGGTGTVGNIAGNANVAPGNSPGILTCSNLTFNSSGDYFVELNGLSPGTGYDQLKVRGTNNLANAVLHVIPGFTNVVPFGSQFIIITNQGAAAITGTFSGLAEGAPVSVNGYGFQISYVGGSGNDVALKLTRLPGGDLYFTNAAGGDFLAALNHDFPRDPDVLYAAIHAYSDLSLRASENLAGMVGPLVPAPHLSSISPRPISTSSRPLTASCKPAPTAGRSPARPARSATSPPSSSKNPSKAPTA